MTNGLKARDENLAVAVVRARPRVRHSRLHLVLTLVWVGLAVPTVVLWPDSILWVAFMSLYANIAGHWAAYEAARAEEERE